jgi:hypothetical protein
VVVFKLMASAKGGKIHQVREARRTAATALRYTIVAAETSAGSRCILGQLRKPD